MTLKLVKNVKAMKNSTMEGVTTYNIIVLQALSTFTAVHFLVLLEVPTKAL